MEYRPGLGTFPAAFSDHREIFTKDGPSARPLDYNKAVALQSLTSKTAPRFSQHKSMIILLTL